MVLKTKRENSNSRRRHPDNSRAVSFATVLSQAMDENQPVDCYTVTYNADRKLQTRYYHPSREYTL